MLCPYEVVALVERVLPDWIESLEIAIECSFRFVDCPTCRLMISHNHHYSDGTYRLRSRPSYLVGWRDTPLDVTEGPI